MKNETDGGGDGNSTTNAQENEGNIYLVDFAYGAFIREKELYAVLFAFFIAAATRRENNIVSGIRYMISKSNNIIGL